MKILSHRGFWIDKLDQNSIKSFKLSFNKGFGTETDLRDFNAKVVISHDIPNNKAIAFENFIEIYKSYNKHQLPLALNIKADGLQKLIKDTLQKNNITNYFAFDMSIPDTIGYINENMGLHQNLWV